jgi:putative glutamine amidotransferase
MRQPLVAITASTRLQDGAERVRLNLAYIRAAEAAGMVPVVLPPLEDAGAAGAALAPMAGLLLSGGEDVNPLRYGVEPHPRTYTPHDVRDAWEIALLHEARERRLPTLAICRGIQVANVALGGTLVQDLASEWDGPLAHDGAVRDRRTHDVQVVPTSRLASLLGTTTLCTNSLHHQALARVAPGLRVTARASDGVIEGVEWDGDDWWMVGVQWHPEELTRTSDGWDRALFAAFADACTLADAQRI